MCRLIPDIPAFITYWFGGGCLHARLATFQLRLYPIMRLSKLYFVALIVLSPAAPAQEHTEPIAQIEVRGPAANQLRRDDAAGRIVVGRAELQRFGETTLAEALKRQPGLSVVGTEIRMRGLGGGYTQILIDGQPAPANFDIATLSPELIERVEIQRSAQADTSMQSVAGSLNIILRNAGGTASASVKLGAEVQAGTRSPAATAQWIGRSGALGYGLTATASETRRQQQGVIDEHTNHVGITARRRLQDDNDARTRRISAAPRADLKLDDGSSLSWQGLMDMSQVDADGVQTEHTLQGMPTASPDAHWRARFNSWLLKSDLSWGQRFDSGKLTFKAGIEANHRDGDYLFHGIDAQGQPWLDRAVDSRAHERRISSSGKYLAPLLAGHDIAIGWDVSQVRRDEYRRQRDTGPAGPDSPPLYRLEQDYHASVSTLALFAQDEWTVTPRLQAYLGLRWEGLDTRTRGGGDAATTSRVWSPVAQLVWKLPDSQRNQLRVALARTYKAPQPRDLVPRRYTVNNDNGPTQPDFQGNPVLRPELAFGLDSALEWYGAGDAMLSLSAYARRIRDVVQLKLWQENGVWVSSPVNDGNAEVHGIELDARLPLTNGASGWPVIELRSSVGRHWSRVASRSGPDNRLGNQAPLIANIGLDLRMAGGVSAGANFRMVGGWRAQTAPSLTVDTGLVRELEAYLAWPAASGKFRLALANLLHGARRTGQHYDDGSYFSQRLSSTAQHPLMRLQYEFQH